MDRAATRAAADGVPVHARTRHGGCPLRCESRRSETFGRSLQRARRRGSMVTAVASDLGILSEQELTVLPLDGVTSSWDEFVSRAEGSSFCHLAGWRDILSDVLGAECFFWVASDDAGQWQGVLPLARVKSRIFGHYLVSLPFLNYGGPLGTSAACRRLVREAVAEARRSRADLLELRTRHGESVGLPPAFVGRRASRFRDRVLFGAVYWDGQPIAAGCGFVWGDEFEMTWSSGLRQHGHRRPNLLLYSRFMEHLIERGVRVFNFGRSTPGSGPHEFKRQWGGRDVPLPWCQHAPRGRTGTPSSDATPIAWGPSVWRCLPLPI